MPLGGWARLDSIHAGVWNRWFPKPVKIPVLSFMEKDHEGKSHWFDLVKGQWIQGLIAVEKQNFKLEINISGDEFPQEVYVNYNGLSKKMTQTSKTTHQTYYNLPERRLKNPCKTQISIIEIMK